jgi:hypothetical protein
VRLFGLTDKDRVLHAALSFPTFTLEDLAKASGVRRETVQTTVARLKDQIEPVGKVESERPGGRAIRYQLRKDTRTKLAREVVRLASRLRGDVGDEGEAAERAETALRALESSVAFAQEPGDSGNDRTYWTKRAKQQIGLSAQMIAMVSEEETRRQLEWRLERMRARIEGSDSAKKRTPMEEWRVFVEYATRGARGALGVHAKEFAPDMAFGTAALAPAALFDATDDSALTARLTEVLRAAHRPFLEFNLGDVVSNWEVSSDHLRFLQALEVYPRHLELIVTLDSENLESRRSVEAFLHGLRDHMWLRNMEAPAVAPEITLIDKAMNEEFVRANQMVRNLNYVNLARGVDKLVMARVMSAVVGSLDKDDARLF